LYYYFVFRDGKDRGKHLSFTKFFEKKFRPHFYKLTRARFNTNQ
jgi:hypothetical protein